MGMQEEKKIQEKILRKVCIGSAGILLAAAFLFDSPQGIISGMKEIILCRDALITDYFELAGYGAGFFNAALMLLLSIVLLESVKIPYTGLTLAALFISMGFGFWGKNPINSIPIIAGVWLYAKFHKTSFARYVYTALFATCLAPFVTELVYVLPFTRWISLLLAILLGLFIGFVIPPLSMHTASMHMGYSLFNVGFSGGVLAFVMFCVLKSLGIESESVFIWKEERNLFIVAGLLIYFLLIFFLGLWLEHGKLSKMKKIMRHPGRAVADFVLMEGSGATLMNMGVLGILTEAHVLLVGGDMSGPMLGCILTVFGFAAFGAHPRNYIPVMLGVYLSTFFTKYDRNAPSILIAACFCVGLSPIAGQFGSIAGIAAGMLHTAIVMCTGQMYGGLNLYNNGFSAGWVAIIMLPILESMMERYDQRKRCKKKTRRERNEE